MAPDGRSHRTYLVFLEAAGALVELPEVSPAVVSHPDDDPILQTAIVGRADVLCTRDGVFRHEVVERVCTAPGIDSESQYRRLLLKLDRMIDRPVAEGMCRNSGDLCNCGRNGRGFPDRGGTCILYVLPRVEQHVRD